MQKNGIKRNNIRHARELRGWSQADVAEKLGCDARSVGRWERGVVFPSSYYRQRLCLLFEQNMEELGLLEKAGQNVHEGEPLKQEPLQEQPEQEMKQKTTKASPPFSFILMVFGEQHMFLMIER